MNGTQDAINLYLEVMKKALTASIYEQSGWQIVGTHWNCFKEFFLRILQKNSLLLVRTKAFDRSQREEGRDWPWFGYTMIGHRRLDNIQMCVEDVLRNKVPGDLIETGAWRGGATIFMRALLKAHGNTQRKVWVADSFAGLPVPSKRDDALNLSDYNPLKVSLDQVKANFRMFDLLDEQVVFLEGWFCDTLPNVPIENVAVLRLDGDMYTSTMDSLRHLYHKVSKGGYVIVDDYYSWPDCRRAVTEFLTEHSIEPDIKRIDWTGVYWKV